MRKEKFKIASLFISGIFLLAVFFFCSCSFDSGLETDRPLPLGNFHAKTVGTASSQYRNPKIAIVWESLTGAISIWDIGNAVIDSTHAGNVSFTGNFSHLPLAAVTNPDSEYVLGKLWLYDDVNGDGRLNLPLPADYLNTLNQISAAKQEFESALFQLRSVADSSLVRTNKLDTFLVTPGSTGNLYLAGSPNPIPNQEGFTPAWSSDALLHARDRVLYAPNVWEEFFNQDDNFESKNPQVRAYGGDTMVVCHSVRYSPQSGEASDFEKALESATLKRAWLDSLIRLAKREVNPILTQTVTSANSDKLIGRSINDNIVYFPSTPSLQMAKDAEKASDFSFAGKDHLNVGFNFVQCDSLRNCNVQYRTNDSVVVSLGQDPAPVFDPPTTPKFFVNPSFAMQSSFIVDSSQSLSHFSGTYRCQCGDTTKDINALNVHGFWIELPNYGLHSFQITDDTTFFYGTTKFSIQVHFSSVDTGSAGNKLLAVVVDRTSAPAETLQFYALYVRALATSAFQTEILDSISSGSATDTSSGNGAHSTLPGLH